MAATALIACWLVGHPSNVRLLLRAVAIAVLLESSYGIAQYFGFDPFLPNSAYQDGEGVYTIVRPPGTLGHANYLGAWLAMAAFCSLALRSLETSRLWRTLAGSASVLSAVAILLSGTRAALLAILAGAVLLFLLRWQIPSRQGLAYCFLPPLAARRCLFRRSG